MTISTCVHNSCFDRAAKEYKDIGETILRYNKIFNHNINCIKSNIMLILDILN